MASKPQDCTNTPSTFPVLVSAWNLIPERQCLIWLRSSICLLTDAMTRTPSTKCNSECCLQKGGDGCSQQEKQKGRLYLCCVLNEWMLLMSVPLISGMWWGGSSCFGVYMYVCVYKSKSLRNGRKQGSSFLIPAENKQWRGMLSSVLTL